MPETTETTETEEIKYSEELETVEIVNVKGEMCRINKADFDEKTMKLWANKDKK